MPAKLKTRARSDEPVQPNPSAPSPDVALVWRGEREGPLNVLRHRSNRLELGRIEPLQEGKPIHGEVVQLHPRENSPLYDVQVHMPAPAAAAPATNPGPPQIATEQYRSNWDAIYARTKALN